jgi:hypothetical protein
MQSAESPHLVRMTDGALRLIKGSRHLSSHSWERVTRDSG